MSPAHFFSARPGGRGNCLTTLAIASLAVSGLMQSLPAAPAAAEAPAVAVVGPYDPATTYPLGSLAVGPDGNTYRAAKDVKGLDPTQATADSWQLALVSKEVILDVPARFESIADAMAFLAGCRIAETAKVVVLIAPGKLEHDEPLVLNHAEGARIVIRGAGKEPEDCVLECNGITVGTSAGEGIQLESLTLKSQEKNQGTGIYLDDGAAATIISCRIVDFARGAYVKKGSRIQASRCEFLTNGAEDCVTVTLNSTGLFDKCAVKAPARQNAANGFSVSFASSMECIDCNASGWYSGFIARKAASLRLNDVTSRNNAHGASAWSGSSLQALGGTFASNQESGLAIMYATGELMGCSTAANRVGVAANGPSLVDVAGKPTKITGSKIGLFSHFGGRFRINTEPVFRDVDAEIAVGGEPGNLTPETAVLRIP